MLVRPAPSASFAKQSGWIFCTNSRCGFCLRSGWFLYANFNILISPPQSSGDTSLSLRSSEAINSYVRGRWRTPLSRTRAAGPIEEPSVWKLLYGRYFSLCVVYYWLKRENPSKTENLVYSNILGSIGFLCKVPCLNQYRPLQSMQSLPTFRHALITTHLQLRITPT